MGAVIVPDEAAASGVYHTDGIAAGRIITHRCGLGLLAVALTGAFVEPDTDFPGHGGAGGIPFRGATFFESGNGTDCGRAIVIVATRSSGRRGLVAAIAATGVEGKRAGG